MSLLHFTRLSLVSSRYSNLRKAAACFEALRKIWPGTTVEYVGFPVDNPVRRVGNTDKSKLSAQSKRQVSFKDLRKAHYRKKNRTV